MSTRGYQNKKKSSSSSSNNRKKHVLPSNQQSYKQPQYYQPVNYPVTEKLGYSYISGQIRGEPLVETSVEYIPFDRTEVEYVPVQKVEYVPQEKQIREYQQVEHIIQKIPIKTYETKIEYVPVERVEEHLEYELHEQKIVKEQQQQQPVETTQYQVVQQPVTQYQIVQQPVQYMQTIAYPVTTYSTYFIEKPAEINQQQVGYQYSPIVQSTAASSYTNYQPQSYAPQYSQIQSQIPQYQQQLPIHQTASSIQTPQNFQNQYQFNPVFEGQKIAQSTYLPPVGTQQQYGISQQQYGQQSNKF